MATHLDEFTRAYLEAALWSSVDDDDSPLDDIYDISDISAASIAKAVRDCAAFQATNAADLAHASGHPQYTADELNGHDFWLTRNQHGCGFWARDWYDSAIGERLTDAATACEECYCYVSDDGLVYLDGGRELAPDPVADVDDDDSGIDPIYKFFDAFNNQHDH